jgi:hypothetical protein
MHGLWHFEQDYDGGWQWVHTDPDSGAVSRSSDIFRTRSACIVDALGNGYLAATRKLPAGKAVTVH